MWLVTEAQTVYGSSSMKALIRMPYLVRTLAACTLLVLALLAYPPTVTALGSPDPVQEGSLGLEGTISSPPPTQAATISTPRNGQSFSSSPITVAGVCKTDLLVKIFSNNVFVGSVVCKNGSYSLQVSLFSGKNDIVAVVYDSLDQAGPNSNLVSVTFIDANFANFGSALTLTSSYARRGALTGDKLTWPITLSGGSGPYALSIDWGDSSGAELLSETFAGVIRISHTYKTAGVYEVVIKATDTNKSTAYLQVVAVASGETSGTVTGGTSGTSGGGASDKVVLSPEWYAFLPVVPLLLLAFWLGARNELYVIRKRLDRARGADQ